MKRQQLLRLKLPDSPGVYTFRDYAKKPLYIGRATSLKDRVKSYFASDLIVTRGPRIIDMVTKAKSLTWETSDSVLEAIILESALIKRYQPFYNVDERDDKSSQYVIITEEEWPRVFLARARDFDAAFNEKRLPYAVKACFGPYPHTGLIKEALKILRRLFPFRDKKAYDPRHESFYRALGRSPLTLHDGAHDLYIRTIKYLILFFEGKKKQLRSRLQRELKSQIKKLAFEEAGETKRLLYALDHIHDIALIKQDKNSSAKNFRIEAYDIAHLSGIETVGAMAVSMNGEPMTSEYRKFKLSKDANDDIAGLSEILSRRLNHTEWTFPDLIVVDGNETHVKHAENILRSRRIAIPVVAVTKDETHTASRLIGLPELVETYKREIIAVNAEVHRFALAYHRLRRGKAFGKFKTG